MSQTSQRRAPDFFRADRRQAHLPKRPRATGRFAAFTPLAAVRVLIPRVCRRRARLTWARGCQTRPGIALPVANSIRSTRCAGSKANGLGTRNPGICRFESRCSSPNCYRSISPVAITTCLPSTAPLCASSIRYTRLRQFSASPSLRCTRSHIAAPKSRTVGGSKDNGGGIERAGRAPGITEAAAPRADRDPRRQPLRAVVRCQRQRRRPPRIR